MQQPTRRFCDRSLIVAAAAIAARSLASSASAATSANSQPLRAYYPARGVSPSSHITAATATAAVAAAGTAAATLATPTITLTGDVATAPNELKMDTMKNVRSGAAALDLSFDDPKAAFRVSKKKPKLHSQTRTQTIDATLVLQEQSTFRLFRSLVILKLCTIGPLVEHSERLLNAARCVLGAKLFSRLLKISLYGHFCAGETRDDVSREKVLRQINNLKHR